MKKALEDIIKKHESICDVLAKVENFLANEGRFVGKVEVDEVNRSFYNFQYETVVLDAGRDYKRTDEGVYEAFDFIHVYELNQYGETYNLLYAEF